MLEKNGTSVAVPGVTVFKQVEYLLKEKSLLSHSFNQVNIEREILAETLSEHSSSFKEERKLANYLNERNDIEELLKDTKPVEKIQILMDLVREQHQEIAMRRMEDSKLLSFLEEGESFISTEILMKKYQDLIKENGFLNNQLSKLHQQIDEWLLFHALPKKSENILSYVEKLKLLEEVTDNQRNELSKSIQSVVILKEICPSEVIPSVSKDFFVYIVRCYKESVENNNELEKQVHLLEEEIKIIDDLTRTSLSNNNEEQSVVENIRKLVDSLSILHHTVECYKTEVLKLEREYKQQQVTEIPEDIKHLKSIWNIYFELNSRYNTLSSDCRMAKKILNSASYCETAFEYDNVPLSKNVEKMVHYMENFREELERINTVFINNAESLIKIDVKTVNEITQPSLLSTKTLYEDVNYLAENKIESTKERKERKENIRNSCNDSSKSEDMTILTKVQHLVNNFVKVKMQMNQEEQYLKTLQGYSYLDKERPADIKSLVKQYGELVEKLYTLQKEKNEIQTLLKDVLSDRGIIYYEDDINNNYTKGNESITGESQILLKELRDLKNFQQNYVKERDMIKETLHLSGITIRDFDDVNECIELLVKERNTMKEGLHQKEIEVRKIEDLLSPRNEQKSTLLDINSLNKNKIPSVFNDLNVIMTDYDSCKVMIFKYKEKQEQFDRFMAHCESKDFFEHGIVIKDDFNENPQIEKLKTILSKYSNVYSNHQKLLKEQSSILECLSLTDNIETNYHNRIVNSITEMQARHNKMENELSSLQSAMQSGIKQELYTNEECISAVEQLNIKILELENCFNEVEELLKNNSTESLAEPENLTPMAVVNKIKELKNLERTNEELSATVETLQGKMQEFQGIFLYSEIHLFGACLLVRYLFSGSDKIIS